MHHSELYGVLQARRGGIGQGTDTPFLIQCDATSAADFDRLRLADNRLTLAGPLTDFEATYLPPALRARKLFRRNGGFASGPPRGAYDNRGADS